MIRKHVLPFLEKQLGGSVAASLVRTSDQLREDNTYLESQADKSFKKYAKVLASGISFDAKALEKLPAAILNRVIKKALDSFGSESSRAHVLAVSDLVLSWHGQKPLALPGVRVVRKGNTISFEPNRR
jgi:tRNA(Ile)-lysidine synthase